MSEFDIIKGKEGGDIEEADSWPHETVGEYETLKAAMSALSEYVEKNGGEDTNEHIAQTGEVGKWFGPCAGIKADSSRPPGYYRTGSSYWKGGLLEYFAGPDEDSTFLVLRDRRPPYCDSDGTFSPVYSSPSAPYCT